MRVIQLSDPHLAPTTHPDGTQACNNERAWRNAERVAALLREQPDADDLVVVVTGDLTDNGHINPEEFAPAAAWLRTLPGTVYALPGNHDVGNFVSTRADPTVDPARLARWREHLGRDRFSHATEGHRLIGLNSMLIGSGLAEEADQEQWVVAELDDAAAAHEAVWIFQHAPLFLRRPDEVPEPREHYWCPAPEARDRAFILLDRPHVRGLLHGHIHRRFDLRHADRLYRACPALSGTHTDADYFPRDPQINRHDLGVMILTPASHEAVWQHSGLGTATRLAM